MRGGEKNQVINASIFDISGLVACVHPCHWPVWPCICLCQINCLPDKQSLYPEHSVPEPPLLKSDLQTQIMWLSWIGFVTGLKHWFQMCTRIRFSCRNTNALIHSHMYSQSNPVSWNRKAAFAEVHTFFKCLLQEGLASDESLAEIYTVTSPWVVNLPSSHQSHLPLVNRIKCSV